ncbi:MAG: metal ABC transporter permease [Leptospirales bacterium]|nr:metal ABC transporter permease [Leptospirales bacterium]
MDSILHYDFMQNALLAAALVSIATGVMGAFVVVNRMVFISGAVAHAAYGGVGMAAYFGWNVTLGAFLFSGVSATAMGVVQRLARERADTIIGALWAIGMAIGIVFIDLSPGYRSDLMSYLFGSILTVSRSALLWMAGLDLLLLAVVRAFYRELTALSFDREFAEIRNIPATALELLLLALAAIAVVLVMQAVGLILVIALLSIPAAIAGRFVRRLSAMMVLASLLGFLFTLIGLVLAYAFNLTSGAAIILTAGVAYLLSLLWPRRVLA